MRTAPSRWVQLQPRGASTPGLLLAPPHPCPPLHPQMQVLLAQVQNSEQLLRTLQGTVSQAQERVQLQMVRAGGPGGAGEEWKGNWLRPTWKVETPVLPPSPTPIYSGFTLELVPGR